MNLIVLPTRSRAFLFKEIGQGAALRRVQFLTPHIPPFARFTKGERAKTPAVKKFPLSPFCERRSPRRPEFGRLNSGWYILAKNAKVSKRNSGLSGNKGSRAFVSWTDGSVMLLMRGRLPRTTKFGSLTHRRFRRLNR